MAQQPIFYLVLGLGNMTICIGLMKVYRFIMMFYRLFRGVAKYIVYGNIFSSFLLSDYDLFTPPTTGRKGETERPARTKPGARS